MEVNDNEAARELVKRHVGNRPEKPRHAQEIRARYEQDIRQYQELSRAKVENREQRLMLYAEIKVLGWCLGRIEQNVLRDIQTPVK